MRRSHAFWGLFALLWLAGAARASAQPSAASDGNTPAPGESQPAAEVLAEYQEVVRRAVAEFELGHVAEARALFLRAHGLWPSARTFRTLGMTAFELRMYPQALAELQQALADPRRPLPAEQRTQVTALIDQARDYVGRYQLQVVPADAELLVDGVRRSTAKPLLVGVGVHQLLVRAQGRPELRRELLVQGREDEALALSLERERGPQLQADVSPTAAARPRPALEPAVPEPSRAPVILAWGVAGAGVIVGSVAGIIAFSKKHDVEHLEAGHRAADISTAAWITAGVAAATGVVLLWVTPQARPREHALQPGLGPGWIALHGTL